MRANLHQEMPRRSASALRLSSPFIPPGAPDSHDDGASGVGTESSQWHMHSGHTSLPATHEEDPNDASSLALGSRVAFVKRAIEAEMRQDAARRRARAGSCAWRAHAFLKDLTADFEFWANFFNILSTVGYVFADFNRAFLTGHTAFTNVLYVVIAVAMNLQALCFYFAWQSSAKVPSYWVLSGDIFNILGSIGYLVTSWMYSQENTDMMVALVLWIEGVMVVLFFGSGLGYLYAWILSIPPESKTRGLTFRDPDAWANLLNITPATIYIVGSICGIWVHYDRLIKRPQDGHSGGSVATSDELKLVAQINVWGDVLYMISAVWYLLSWYRGIRAWRSDDEPEEDDDEVEEDELEDTEGVGAAPLHSAPGSSALHAKETVARLLRNARLQLAADEESAQFQLGYMDPSVNVDDVFDGFQVFGYFRLGGSRTESRRPHTMLSPANANKQVKGVLSRRTPHLPRTARGRSRAGSTVSAPAGGGGGAHLWIRPVSTPTGTGRVAGRGVLVRSSRARSPAALSLPPSTVTVTVDTIQ